MNDILVSKIQQEAAELALKLYNLQQTEKAIKTRLKELNIAISALTTETNEDKSE